MPYPLPPIRKPALARKILAVVARTVFSRGVSALRMDAVAAELGVSKKTLYVHYSSKAHLLAAMLDAHLHDYAALLQAVRDDPAASFSAQLQKTIELNWEADSHLPAEVLNDFGRHASALWGTHQQFRALRLGEHFHQLLLMGQRQGLLRGTMRPDVLATMLVRLISKDLPFGMPTPQDYTVQQVCATLHELLFEGVFSEAARQEPA